MRASFKGINITLARVTAYVYSFCCIFRTGAVNQNEATLAFTGEASNIDIRIDEYDEVIELFTQTYHSTTQRRDAEMLKKNIPWLQKGLFVPQKGVLLDIKEGCILLRIMLVTAESVDYYKDPEQWKALGEKLKEMLKTLRKKNDLDFSDVDGMKINISEEDIQKAERFFRIGKYHRDSPYTVVIKIYKFDIVLLRLDILIDGHLSLIKQIVYSDLKFNCLSSCIFRVCTCMYLMVLYM